MCSLMSVSVENISVKRAASNELNSTEAFKGSTDSVMTLQIEMYPPPPPLPPKKEGKKLREKTKPVAQTLTLTSKDINCSDKIATIALNDTERPIFHFATVSNIWKQYTCFQHDWHVKNDRHAKLAIHHEHIYRMCVPSCPNEMIGYFRDNAITITSVI